MYIKNDNLQASYVTLHHSQQNCVKQAQFIGYGYPVWPLIMMEPNPQIAI